MSRFLQRAAVAASRALGRPSDPRPFSGLFLASASPSGVGHLGLLARARPDLDAALLTPEALLLDATHVLFAAALNDRPHTGRMTRRFADDAVSENSGARLLLTLIDAEDGRFGDMLHNLARLAAGSHGPTGSARICAAGICEALGRVDERDRWLAGVAEAECACPREDISFHLALVTATVGGAPAAVAGAQGQVAAAAFRLIDQFVADGGMSAFQIVLTGLLKSAVARRCKKDPAVKQRDNDDGILLRAVADAVSRYYGRGVPKKSGGPFFVVQSFQALLSAVVLRALPLCGERVHAALRVVGRELARAVEGRDPTATTDLRLLLAFLAARNGYVDEALDTYAAAARDDARDPRPRYLAHQLCALIQRPEEADKWRASYDGLAAAGSSPLDGELELATLTDELVVAVALGGGFIVSDEDARFPAVMRKILSAAGSRVDAALVSALRDKEMPLVEKMEARAARACLHAGVWSALKEFKSKIDGAATATKRPSLLTVLNSGRCDEVCAMSAN
ncbi:hypothetical protein EJB05_15764, partial [Eragrostis curvula]